MLKLKARQGPSLARGLTVGLFIVLFVILWIVAAPRQLGGTASYAAIHGSSMSCLA